MAKIQSILPDPSGSNIGNRHLVTVTRPRQVVVHKIAETFYIELIAKDFMDLDEDGCNLIPTNGTLA
jgi:hypothetical protein